MKRTDHWCVTAHIHLQPQPHRSPPPSLQLIVQRNQTKRIEEQESQRSEWPAKVSSLMADLRVAKDKLRKAKEKEARVESSTRKQHEALVRLQQKNKHLQEQLAQHERGHGGRSHGDRERHKLVRSGRRALCGWRVVNAY